VPPEDIESRLAKYAADLCASGAIRTDRVRDAFERVPRHRFPSSFYFGPRRYEIDHANQPTAEVLDLVYANHALVTKLEAGGEPRSSTSQPSVMARMLEALALRPGMRVLEIGAGTGYNAALIFSITGGRVTTVDIGRSTADAARAAIHRVGLADQVTVKERDGYFGDDDGAKWDRIIATCGIAGIPAPWLEQLADDGLIVAPVALAGRHPIMAVRPDGANARGVVVCWADFMTAVGPLRPAAYFSHDPLIPLDAQTVVSRGTIAGELTWDQYHALTVYLGVHDSRTSRANIDVNLLDPAQGTTALVDRGAAAWIQVSGAIRTAGAEQVALELSDRVSRLAAAWFDDGQPGPQTWQADFVRHERLDPPLFTPKQWVARLSGTSSCQRDP
jgi:protein-L-isoaspartate(D-aspartate) O-methyltransferase